MHASEYEARRRDCKSAAILEERQEWIALGSVEVVSVFEEGIDWMRQQSIPQSSSRGIHCLR